MFFRILLLKSGLCEDVAFTCYADLLDFLETVVRGLRAEKTAEELLLVNTLGCAADRLNARRVFCTRP